MKCGFYSILSIAKKSFDEMHFQIQYVTFETRHQNHFDDFQKLTPKYIRTFA